MKNIHLLLIAFICFFSSMVQAQSWLPQQNEPQTTIRLLGCTYDDAKLSGSHLITPDSKDWSVKTENAASGNQATWTFIFTAKRAMDNAGVAVAFDQYGWTSDNYVMIPAIVYNGNRQRIVNREYATGLDKSDYYREELALTSNPIPQLSPEFGAKSRLEVNISNTATPVISFLERKKQQGTFLFTDQGIDWQGEMKDHVLIVEESPDRSLATFVISAPGVRERKAEFIGFSESPDRGISVKEGDEICIRVTRVDMPCEDVPTLLRRFMEERKQHTVAEPPRNLMPMSEVFARMIRNIDERYYINKEKGWEYYCPENADWMSFGWIGGLMNTFPMLALNDSEHIRKVSNTFHFALSRAKGKSGYYYDTLGSNGEVLNRDAAVQVKGIGLTRKNADVLYWMIKQFMLMREQNNTIDPDWEENIRLLADAFAATWKNEGTWGNYFNIETGRIAVYNTTGGAMAVGGMALASAYYNVPEYMEIACEAADYYYDNYALVGFTSGGCGDILQNADSETAAALMTSMMVLYEMTQDATYLKRCASLADLCATWTVSFPYRLPENTPLAKLGANLTGAVWASTQNKHGAPGFCTQSGDALFKLYRATGDTLYAGLMRDIIHAHAEGVQPNGKITERLTYCDADSRGSRGDGGKTGWNETNGAMMALEIPGIYVRTDLLRSYVFDHVEIKDIKKTNKGIMLTLHNPTAFDATVTVLAEDAEGATLPLGENAFVRWGNKVKVKAGKTVNYKVARI